MTRRKQVLLLSMAALSAGCVTQIERTPLQAQRLAAAPRVSLACSVTLVDVVDARPGGESAGVYNGRALQFARAPDLVREHLVAAGVGTGAAADGMRLTVQLKRLYMAQQHAVNTPVVVLQAQLGDTPPFLVRPQVPSVNWWGSEAELYDDLGAAVARANTQLVQGVNQRCPKAVRG